MHRINNARLKQISTRLKQWNFVSKLSFGDKTTAQILKSNRYSPPLYKPLYHHLDRKLLKPRNPGSFAYLLHHLQSSLMGFYSICTSQQSRDDFLRLTARNEGENKSDSNDVDENTGIINTFILKQSDMGFMKVMTLYQDLSSPLFDENNFDTEAQLRQFLSGCSFALEQVHTAQTGYMKKLEAAFDNINNETGDKESIFFKDGEQEEFQYQFLDIAKNDPESTESALTSMLSPEGLDGIFSGCISYCIYRFHQMMESEEPVTRADKSRAQWPSDTTVINYCLLSARVEEIQASVNEVRDNTDSDPDAPLEDESLQPFTDRKTQVVLQLEVLYDLEFSSKSVDGDNKNHKSVKVAKFETCIKNDPNGNELQWRLCSLRPAKEFGNF